jgi:multidrug resistance protein, MATE family
VSLRREIGGLAALAFPLCLGHLGQHLMSIVDTAVLGRYSSAALAGSGLAGNILFAIMLLGVGTVMGLDTLVPQSLGAGETGRARELYAAGVRLALVLSLPVSALVAGVALLLPLTPIEPGVADEAAAFLVARLPGVAPFLLFAAMRSYLQAHQITRPMVLAVVIGNIVNFLGDLVLVFGDDGLTRVGLPPIGLPPLGALGAGLATSIVSLGSLVVLGMAVRGLHRGQPEPSSIRRAEHTHAIIRLGSPVGLQLLAEVGIFGLAGFLAATLGRLPSAGHQVALVQASFSFATALGIGAATSVLVGRAIGAGDTQAARRAGAIGMTVGAAVMGVAGLLFLFMPRQLAGLFTDDPALISAAVPLLRIAAVFQLSDAVQAISAGALRGAGATRFPFVANLVGHYAFGLPVAILLGFWMDMGAAGLWWGLSLGLTGVAIAQSVRFRVLTSRPVARA